MGLAADTRGRCGCTCADISQGLRHGSGSEARHGGRWLGGMTATAVMHGDRCVRGRDGNCKRGASSVEATRHSLLLLQGRCVQHVAGKMPPHSAACCAAAREQAGARAPSCAAQLGRARESPRCIWYVRNARRSRMKGRSRADGEHPLPGSTRAANAHEQREPGHAAAGRQGPGQVTRGCTRRGAGGREDDAGLA